MTWKIGAPRPLCVCGSDGSVYRYCGDVLSLGRRCSLSVANLSPLGQSGQSPAPITAMPRHREVVRLLFDLVVLPLAVLIFVAIAPVVIPVLLILGLPKQILIGIVSSDDQQGLDAFTSWLRFERSPYTLRFLLLLVVDLPIMVLVYASIILSPIFWFALRFALFISGCFDRRGAAVGDAGDLTAPLRATRPKGQPALVDRARYSEHASIWAALEGDGDKIQPGDVQLLSLKWLMALADKGDALPRRQELPDEAFLTAKQLRGIEARAKLTRTYEIFLDHLDLLASKHGSARAVGKAVCAFLTGRIPLFKRNADGLLPIVSVSYCWLEASHPDKDGRQLQLLASSLRQLYGRRGLLGACRAYGFSDMGVFLDWASGYQKDPKLWVAWMTDRELYNMSDEALENSAVDGAKMVAERRTYEASRSIEQKAAFDRMLHGSMDLWYAHAGVTVILMTQLPDEVPTGFDKTRTYGSRGWTTFERCSAELIKKNWSIARRWDLVINVGETRMGKNAIASRRLPTTPKQMATLLESCQFTNGADKGAVLALYKKTAETVLGSVHELDFRGLPIVRTDPWRSPRKLAEGLNLCTNLRTLYLRGSRMDHECMMELAANLDDGALPALNALDIGCNRYGALGITVLCDAFRRGIASNLKRLVISCQNLGDAGTEALAAALMTGGIPSQLLLLEMMGTDMGDHGARALASALRNSGLGVQLGCTFLFNGIGFAGQLSLVRVQEAMHGWMPLHFVAMLFNPPLFPRTVSRAFARGWRRGRDAPAPA